jgi:SAM-dependent methyltransferase
MDDETIECYSHALAGVAAIYHCTLEEYGRSASGVAWKTAEDQFRRFEILTAGINNDQPLTVNDVGCGYGALFGFLDRRFQLAGYCGSDICESMVEAASATVTDPRARFLQSAFPPSPAHWSLASGTFNISGGSNDHIWRSLVEDVLRTMAHLSSVGFAFNMLRPERRDEFLWGDDPEPWQRFCQDQLGGQVSLVDWPDGGEWSLLVSRG